MHGSNFLRRYLIHLRNKTFSYWKYIIIYNQWRIQGRLGGITPPRKCLVYVYCLLIIIKTHKIQKNLMLHFL
jgi:hypothetical protein